MYWTKVVLSQSRHWVEVFPLQAWRKLQEFGWRWNGLLILTLIPRLSNTDELKVEVRSWNCFFERSFLRCIAVNSSIHILLGSGLGLLMKSRIFGPKLAGSFATSWTTKAASWWPWCLYTWALAKWTDFGGYLVQIALASELVWVAPLSARSGNDVLTYLLLGGRTISTWESSRFTKQVGQGSFLLTRLAHKWQRLVSGEEHKKVT